jgi:hypothetical protein
MAAARRAALALAIAGALLSRSPAARSQEIPLVPPPADRGPPPGGYYPPPIALPPWANPKTIEYEEGDPIPPGYDLQTRANRGLLIAGFTVWGTPYLISLVTGTVALLSDDRDADTFWPLLVPVGGPFIALSTLDAEGSGIFWLTVDGVVQAGGVLMVAAAFASEDMVLERRQEPGEWPSPNARAGAELRPAVLVGPGSAALRWRF